MGCSFGRNLRGVCTAPIGLREKNLAADGMLDFS